MISSSESRNPGVSGRASRPAEKKTCLWVGGWFRMPLRLIDDSLPVDENYIHYLGSHAKNDKGKDLRSVTPAGFASAVFLANATQDRPFVGCA